MQEVSNFTYVSSPLLITLLFGILAHYEYKDGKKWHSRISVALGIFNALAAGAAIYMVATSA